MGNRPERGGVERRDVWQTGARWGTMTTPLRLTGGPPRFT